MKLRTWFEKWGWVAKHDGVHCFRGGLHIPAHKAQSTGQPSRMASLPPQLFVSLRQRDGVMQIPQVQVGERVLRGQLLSLPVGSASVARHAPTSGIVSAITVHADIHPSALPASCIVIDSDGKDEPAPPLPDLSDWQHQSRELLLERIRDCGIVGMGGAGFPTARKLGHCTKTLVVNAAECEPYITCDDMQIRECAADIVVGVQIAAQILAAEQVIFGIEDDKPEAISALRAAVTQSGDTRLQVKVVPVRYPSGNSRQLFELLLGIRVPPEQHAADFGLICHNSGTMKAVYDAVVRGMPLIERYVSVTGEAVTRPQVLRARLGTPVSALIAEAGGACAPHRLLIGGPMMGHTLCDSSAGIKKTTNCILLLPEMTQGKEEACIRCARCATACPMALLPQQLYWYSRNQQQERLTQYRLFDCIECGICASVCPSHIPLVQYYQHSKATIRHAQAQKALAERARERHEARQARLAREKAEREARMAEKRATLQARQQEILTNTEALSSHHPTTTAHLMPVSDDVQRAIKQGKGFDPTAQHLAATGQPKQSAIEAAKARAAARRAARQSAQSTQASDSEDSANTRDSKLAAAKAKAEARRAARQSAQSIQASDSEDSVNTRDSKLAEAKAKAEARRAARQSAQSIQASDSEDTVDARDSKLAAAKAKAEARRVARQQRSKQS